jgi:hypothetical protein
MTTRITFSEIARRLETLESKMKDAETCATVQAELATQIVESIVPVSDCAVDGMGAVGLVDGLEALECDMRVLCLSISDDSAELMRVCSALTRLTERAGQLKTLARGY